MGHGACRAGLNRPCGGKSRLIGRGPRHAGLAGFANEPSMSRIPAMRGRLRWLLRGLVSLGIVVYILVDVDLGALGRALADVRLGPIVGAFALYLGGQALSAYKWALIGRSVGFARPLAEYTRFYFIGMFFNLFGPSTIGGDVVR